MRQKKSVPQKRQPTWEEWVSPGETVANKSTYDPVDLADASADHPGLTPEGIANLAYSYWEARGCEGGSAEEDWLRAEAEIQQRGFSRALAA
jgi:hypothetical protein